MSNFAEKLKSLINSREMSMRTLSKEVGISDSQISKYANGSYEPSVANAIKLANYFDCSLDFLFGIDDINKKHPLTKSANVDIFKPRFLGLIDKNNTNINKISKNTNINRNCIYKWLASATLPKTGILVLLANELHTSMEYLVGRTSEMEA